MPDMFTPEKRSWVMSRIRSKDTKIEKIMERLLTQSEIKFEKHYKLIGTPDFAIPRKKMAIFCDSGFFHGDKRTMKRLNKLPEYWQNKIKRNMARATKVNKELKKSGWVVIRFWDSEIEKNVESCIERVKSIYSKTKYH